MTDDLRCALISAADHEPMAGTAPTGTRHLFVEHAGPWGPKALQDSRLPEAVRAHLAGWDGWSVHLVRRHGRTATGNSLALFAALAREDGSGFDVLSASVATPQDVAGVAPPRGAGDGWLAHEAPLWLVCTNGARDRCCTELGRPVTGVLAARWPEETWEITHLGGHRFAATLLALPSGHTLGRLTPDTALAAAESVLAGGVPLEFARGRAGLAGADQAHELHVMAGGDPGVRFEAAPGPVRRQSCGDGPPKPTTVWVARQA